MKYLQFAQFRKMHRRAQKLESERILFEENAKWYQEKIKLLEERVRGLEAWNRARKNDPYPF